MVKNRIIVRKKALLALKNLSAANILRKSAELSIKQIYCKYFGDALLALNNFGPIDDKITAY